LIITSEQVLADSGLTNIDVCMLGEKLNFLPEKAKAAFDILISKGILIQVDNICIYEKTMQYIVNILCQHFKKNETITLAQLRDMLETSRKVALPLLDYLDMNKYTVRIGDVRQAGPKIMNLSEK